MYWFKCCRCTVSSIFPVQSNNTQQYITALRETHNSLHQRVFSFLSFFCQPYPKQRIIRSKKNILQTMTELIQFSFFPIKRKFPKGYLFNTHLFNCISFKWALSSGQKPVYTVKILVSEKQPFLQCFTLNKFLFSAG